MRIHRGITSLGRVLGDARTVLLVASPRAAGSDWLGPALAGREVVRFDGFTPNPRVAQVRAGRVLRDQVRPDVVLGVGGGSAMDVAKAVRHPADPRLVLVPTTAGSGAEVTGFATLYHRGRKTSLDAPGVAADAVVVDPALVVSCPPAVRSAAAADGFCHAVESYWSRRATPRSRRAATRALRLLEAGDLVEASIWAGRAIAETRTTAAHAFAYPLTTRYGVPHGIAALLNLQWVWPYNAARVPVRLAGDPASLLDRDGWPTRLRDYGVPYAAIPGLVRAGLASTARAGNNPAVLRPTEVRAALAAIW